MATPRKRVKPKEPVVTKHCCMCTAEKPSTEYYKSFSSVFSNLDSMLPICKSCISDLYTYYIEEKSYSIRMSVISVCRKLDIYYSEDMFIKSVEEYRANPTRPLINIYIAKCNLTLINKNEKKTFEDSDVEEINAQKAAIVADPDREITPDQKKKLIRFWGEGYDASQMIRMQTYYEQYLKAYSSDLAKRNYFRMIAMEQLRLDLAQTSKERSDIINTISKLTKDANISPKDTEQSKQMDDRAILGTKIREIEELEPIDYMVKEKALYVDVNKFGKLIKQYLYQPMGKLFGGER